MAISLPIKLSICLVFLLATQNTIVTSDGTPPTKHHITDCSIEKIYDDDKIANFRRVELTDVKIRFYCTADETKPDLSEYIAESKQLTCGKETVEASEITFVEFSQFCKLDTLPDRIFTQFASVHTLNIQELSIKSFTHDSLSIKHPIKNVFVNASSNQIATIDETSCPTAGHVTHLDLSNNQLQVLDWLAFSVYFHRLNILNLNGNKIRKANALPDKYRMLLTQIRLADNDIVKVADVFGVVKNPALKVLDLSENNIPTLYGGDFSTMIKLETLDLSNSHVVNIEMGTFAPLNKLINLDLSNNELVTLNFDIFLPAMRHLSVLNLNGNQLSELTKQTDQLFPQLTELVISENNFSCSYLKEYLLTLRLDAAAVEVNPNYTIPNMRGISCNEQKTWRADTGRGFDDGYDTSIFVLVLWIGLANLAIVAIIWFKKFR